MKKALILTAAVLAAVFVFLLATLPPNPFRVALDGVDPALRARTASGVYHIHTTRSDGAGSKADAAAAAADAGHRFAIFTEHGDGTRAPDPPAYLHGVLCLDGVEISTDGGHYVAIGMGAAPYPLGGEPSAVVDDVRRLGGFGVVAHPDHPVRELAWSGWDEPFDAMEWINADVEWRDESRTTLARTLLNYFVRPAPALAWLLDRPIVNLERWDALQRRRPVVALAAADAHGGTRARLSSEGSGRLSGGPSYLASFSSLSNRVILEKPPTGDAAADAALLLNALRAGRAYSVVDAISPDLVLSHSGAGFEPASDLRGGQRFTISLGDRRRVEVHAPHAPGTPPVPWGLSNWAGPLTLPLPAVAPLSGERKLLALASEWRVEKDDRSSGRVSAAGEVLALEYRLAAGERNSQFVAAVADVRGVPDARSLVFRAHSTGPSRVSVQLRFADQRRWRRSVYLDPTDREIVIDLATLVAADRSGAPVPPLGDVRSILLVVDLVNARPGDTGAFTITSLSTTF